MKRAFIIFSTTDLLQKQLNLILFVFQKYDNFPKRETDQVLYQEKENHRVIWRVQPEINDVSNHSSLNTQKKSFPLKLFDWVSILPGTNQISDVKFFCENN